jgi:phosphatidate cytidylyltransferase
LAQGRADGSSGRVARAGWADLRLRVLSAVVLAPIAVAVVWLGGIFWTLLMILLAAGMAFEWVLLCGCRLGRLPGLAVLVAVIAIGAIAAGPTAWALPVLAATYVATWVIAARIPDLRAPRPASLAAGVIYIGLPCIALIWLRHDPLAGLPNILFLLLVVWASDVGAYLAGRLLGGPRLAPRISPGKTWAGALGGLLATIAMGYIVAVYFMPSTGGGLSWRVALVAAALGLAAQLGDLLESAIKRRFGVKDSGRLIPGHGGLFDRLDGFLTAGPLAALLALALGPGVMLWQ